MAQYEMLRHRVLRVVVAAVLGAAGSAAGHAGSYVFPIFELPTADLPTLGDGTLEDWEEVMPLGSEIDYTYFESGRVDEAIDITDLAWRVYLAWHSQSQRLYLAIERVDWFYLSPDPYHNERSEFLVDGDHSGEAFLLSGPTTEDERKRFTESQAQKYAMKSEPFEATGRIAGGAGWASFATETPYAEFTSAVDGDEPRHVFFEAYVTPWDDLNWAGPEVSSRSVLEPGRIIGFSIRLLDMDSSGRAHNYSLVEFPRDAEDLFSANSFADGELIPCFEGDCSHGSTAAAPSSWGRIKAAVQR